MINKSQIEKRKKEIASKQKCKKVIYDTKSEARIALRTHNLKGRKTKTIKNKLTDVYYCHECSAWHLTSQPKFTNRIFKKMLNNN